MEQQVKLGKLLRKEYIEEQKFLSAGFHLDEVNSKL